MINIKDKILSIIANKASKDMELQIEGKIKLKLRNKKTKKVLNNLRSIISYIYRNIYLKNFIKRQKYEKAIH